MYKARVLGSVLGGFSLLILVAVLGCTSTQSWKSPVARDAKENPEQLRPDYCSGGSGLWWPMSAADREAFSRRDAAKAGDAGALLDLAIFASGAGTSESGYEAIQIKVKQFEDGVRPRVRAAKDAWHRGYELHRAMHEDLFKNEGPLQNYDFYQSRVTEIFESGKYNCISSAMLFTVLARGLDMPVRGVSVPTHAFVELGPVGGKVFEVETTSDTGFDLVHDARFYREAAQQWSAERGLAAVTYEQYKARKILEPVELIALGMFNQSIQASGATKNLLMEAAAVLDPSHDAAQTHRFQSYVQEAGVLREQGAANTTVKMTECVRPAVQRALKQQESVAPLAVWLEWFYADALSVLGRGQEALAVVKGALASVQDGWEDAAALRQNLLGVVMEQMLLRGTQQDFDGAIAAITPYQAQCRADAACAHNLQVVYQNWYVKFHQEGNWPRARAVLQDCVVMLPESEYCETELRDLESRHQF